MNEKHIISLREYFDAKFEALEKSIELSRASMEKRLEGMNEFREQLNKQAGTFITKTELDLTLQNIIKDKRSDIALLISIIAIVSAILMSLKK